MVKLYVTKINEDYSCIVENQVVAKNKGAKEYEVEFCGWKGKFYLADHVPIEPKPTKEEVQAIRADLYTRHKDPITCQIQSLRDEEPSPEIEAEITRLINERKLIVEEIRANNPYPEE